MALLDLFVGFLAGCIATNVALVIAFYCLSGRSLDQVPLWCILLYKSTLFKKFDSQTSFNDKHLQKSCPLERIEV